MVLITEIFVMLVVIFFVGWWYKMANKNKDFYDSLPGPAPLPVFGNALEIQSTADFLQFLWKYSKQFDGLFKMQAGPFYRAVIVTDYKFLESILNSTRILKKSREYVFGQNWLGTGLLTSHGEKWRKHRKIITPAFHFQILEQFLDVFHFNAAKLMHKLEKEVGKSSVDIHPFIALCALDIISESAMGIKINAQDHSESPYVRSVHVECKIVIERGFSLLQMFNITYPLTKNYYREKNALKILHNQTNSIIIARANKMKNNKTTNNDKDNFETKQRLAFLDLLLQATKDGKPLTQEEIREEVDTFMFEGHDTTASAISFALFCLANHPEVQKKVLEELLTLLGDDKGPELTYADLQNMKYLEQVIKEAMRMYTTVPFVGRITTEPIEIDGKTIPEDVPLLMFLYGIHHNPDYYKDPEKFDPSRFDTIDGTLPFAYLPFSAGPRNCIGQKFAMLEMKSIISTIVRKFELGPASPQHKMVLAAEAVLKSNNGVKISLKLRQ